MSPTFLLPRELTIYSDTTSIYFSWRTLPEAGNYAIEVSSEYDFSDIVFSDQLTDTITVSSPLPEGLYYCRVKAKNTVGRWGRWSKEKFLTVQDTSDGFVFVPAGAFRSGDGNTLERIEYDYEIMMVNVTNEQYMAYLEEALSVGDIWVEEAFVSGYYAGDDHTDPGEYDLLYLHGRIRWNGDSFVIYDEQYLNHPVVRVSCIGAKAYAQHYGMRLPTEAEWEKAARAVSDWRYPWGNEIDGSRANFEYRGDPWDNGTTPVGYYNGENHDGFQTKNSPSLYGSYDMCGNVYDWTSTWYNDRVVARGGSWDMMSACWRCFCFAKVSNEIGFRCVRENP